MPARFRMLIFLGVLALISPAGNASAPADSAPTHDPFIGTWVLNVAKSELAGPAPKSEFRTFALGPGGMVLCTITAVNHEGRGSFVFWEVRLDGSESGEYSSEGGATPIRMLHMKRVDPSTIEIVVKYTKHTHLKHEGILSATGSFVVSKDGKTLTYKAQNTSPDGQKTQNVRIFDKQP